MTDKKIMLAVDEDDLLLIEELALNIIRGIGNDKRSIKKILRTVEVCLKGKNITVKTVITGFDKREKII